MGADDVTHAHTAQHREATVHNTVLLFYFKWILLLWMVCRLAWLSVFETEIQRGKAVKKF